MDNKNLYQMLGVKRRATSEQIRDAYREMARVYHPDSNFYDEIIEAPVSSSQLTNFKDLTAAYNTLINDEKRKEYDDTLAPDLQGWEAGARAEGEDPSFTKREESHYPYAMGTFGSVRTPPRTAFHDSTVSEVKSVAEMIFARKRLWWRLKSMLRF